MPQSLTKNYIHIVFSTKHRHPFIQPVIEVELHNYLSGICRNLNCQPLKIGGYTDHVHILCILSKNLELTKLTQRLKSSTSKWIKTKDNALRKFFWQSGYGAFSVGQHEVDSVAEYIANQHEHHRSITFREEYRALLKEHNIEFDERYVWD